MQQFVDIWFEMFSIVGGGTDDVPPAEAPTQLPASPPAVADSPADPGLNQGQRPLLLPNSAAKLSPALLMVTLLGIMLVNKM